LAPRSPPLRSGDRSAKVPSRRLHLHLQIPFKSKPHGHPKVLPMCSEESVTHVLERTEVSPRTRVEMARMAGSLRGEHALKHLSTAPSNPGFRPDLLSAKMCIDVSAARLRGPGKLPLVRNLLMIIGLRAHAEPFTPALSRRFSAMERCWAARRGAGRGDRAARMDCASKGSASIGDRCLGLAI